MGMAPGKRTLDSVAILRVLTYPVRADLESRCVWRTVYAKESIVHFQDDTSDVFFLVRGKARVIIYSIAGKAVSFRDIAAGNMFGEFSSFDGDRRSATVEALETCFVASLPGPEFRKLLKREPALMEALLVNAVAQLRALTERVFEFTTLAVCNRIQGELLRLARNGQVDGFQATISRFPTHGEIASRISTHREAVTRELNRLARTGLLERRGRVVLIKDVPRLARMVQKAGGD